MQSRKGFSGLGFGIRLVAGAIMTFSLPFLVLNPSSIFAQISFAFGGFLLVLGGVL